MNVARLTDIAQGVARAHIEPLGFALTLHFYGEGLKLGLFDGREDLIEHLLLKGMPDAVQEEYVHCRVHALAGKLIARRYPT